MLHVAIKKPVISRSNRSDIYPSVVTYVNSSVLANFVATVAEELTGSGPLLISDNRLLHKSLTSYPPDEQSSGPDAPELDTTNNS